MKGQEVLSKYLSNCYASLNFMEAVSILDFHTHLLPGLDDGSSDWRTAVVMAQLTLSQGASAVFLTPHHTDDWYAPSRDVVLAATEEMRQRLAAARIEIEVYPGAEARLRPALPELVRRKEVLTMADRGKHLLVEFPRRDLPSNWRDILHALMSDGVTPILAHPERYGPLADDPDVVAGLVDQGVLVQVNSGSLLGHYGDAVRECALRLARARQVHFLGSDAHDPIDRPPRLREAARLLERVLGTPGVRAVLRGNPGAVIEGRPVPPLPARHGGEPRADGFVTRFWRCLGSKKSSRASTGSRDCRGRPPMLAFVHEPARQPRERAQR